MASGKILNIKQELKDHIDDRFDVVEDKIDNHKGFEELNKTLKSIIPLVYKVVLTLILLNAGLRTVDLLKGYANASERNIPEKKSLSNGN